MRNITRFLKEHSAVQRHVAVSDMDHKICVEPLISTVEFVVNFALLEEN